MVILQPGAVMKTLSMPISAHVSFLSLCQTWKRYSFISPIAPNIPSPLKELPYRPFNFLPSALGRMKSCGCCRCWQRKAAGYESLAPGFRFKAYRWDGRDEAGEGRGCDTPCLPQALAVMD